MDWVSFESVAIRTEKADQLCKPHQVRSQPVSASIEERIGLCKCDCKAWRPNLFSPTAGISRAIPFGGHADYFSARGYGPYHFRCNALKRTLTERRTGGTLIWLGWPPAAPDEAVICARKIVRMATKWDKLR
jgi:hypothetical protein